LARAGRENLQCVAADAVSVLGGMVDSSGGGGVNADAPGR